MLMNLLSGSGRLSVGPVAPGIFDNLSTERVTTTEPGILVVYVDNQTIGKDVWFDNVQVLHYNTQVLEENHYYPYGLTVSASAMGITPQPLKYQGIELEKSFGLETYETFYRGLDPQLGRWNGIDIKSEKYYSLSPYAAMGNNPVMLVDPLGDDTWVYGSNGVLSQIIQDDLPNQIHFIDKEIKEYSGVYKGKDANDVAKAIRAGSIAFIGENTVKSAKQLAMKSANIDKNKMPSGKELAVWADISDTREIIFKELPAPDEIKNKASSGSYPFGEVKKFYKDNNINLGDFFGLGHTHVEGYHKHGLFPAGIKESSIEVQLGNWKSPTYPEDYNMAPRSNMPMFILSPAGITIYNKLKVYDDESVHRYDQIGK